ncbi:glycosyltransferase [Candidatus Pacearchaeota archaeon]|nr:MAG: glycosyltransferase [Candidatus Pacearchaeota archaeon]
MKIATIINSLTTGGAEQQFVQLCEHLKQTHDLQLFLLEQDTELPSPVTPHILSSAKRTTPAILRAASYIRSLLTLRTQLQRLKPAMTISSLELANIAAILSAKKWRTIVKVESFLSRQYQHGFYGVIFRKLIQRYYRRADLVVANSTAAKKDLIEKFGLEEARVVVIHNWLDIKRVQALAREPLTKEETALFSGQTIVTVGRLTEAKGYDFLIESFTSVAQKGIRLVIIGDGEERARLEKLARKGSGAITFLGRRENPFKYVARADLFVLSSRWEGFPNVLLEALAIGTPCLAVDCQSGPREILAPRSKGKVHGLKEAPYGFLTPPIEEQTPMEFGKTLLEALSLRRTLQHYKQQGPRRAKAFSKQKQLAAFDALINQLAKDL